MAETEGDARTETEGSVDVETELLILKYQKNTDPDIKTLNLLEYWGREGLREDRGEKMRRCIQLLVEDELIKRP